MNLMWCLIGIGEILFWFWKKWMSVCIRWCLVIRKLLSNWRVRLILCLLIVWLIWNFSWNNWFILVFWLLCYFSGCWSLDGILKWCWFVLRKCFGKWGVSGNFCILLSCYGFVMLLSVMNCSVRVYVILSWLFIVGCWKNFECYFLYSNWVLWWWYLWNVWINSGIRCEFEGGWIWCFRMVCIVFFVDG